MIKSDTWIRRMCHEHKMIEPFEEKQVRLNAISYGISSYGYDLRIADEFKIFTNINTTIVDPKNFDPKNFVDFKGDALFQFPAQHGDCFFRAAGELIKMLDKHADVTQARTDGKTPLFIAVEKEHPATVTLLLDNGADVMQTRTDDGATVLHVAASQGHREIVTLLLEHGADKSAEDTAGHRPVDIARQHDHNALVPLLEP
jgi:ankyrin repeat protein